MMAEMDILYTDFVMFSIVWTLGAKAQKLFQNEIPLFSVKARALQY